MKTLSVNRANQIVEIAQREIELSSSSKSIFMCFREGGAKSRLQAANAYYLAMADFYRKARERMGTSKTADDALDLYAQAGGVMLLELAVGDIANPKDFGLGNLLSAESFADYLRTLDPKAKNFWPLVYAKLNLRYCGSGWCWILMFVLSPLAVLWGVGMVLVNAQFALGSVIALAGVGLFFWGEAYMPSEPYPESEGL